SQGNVAAWTDGAAEGTDLLLQHGLLRSFAWQPERCPSAFADQLQNGFFVSRSCEARSRFETPPRNLVAPPLRDDAGPRSAIEATGKNWTAPPSSLPNG